MALSRTNSILDLTKIDPNTFVGGESRVQRLKAVIKSAFNRAADNPIVKRIANTAIVKHAWNNKGEMLLTGSVSALAKTVCAFAAAFAAPALGTVAIGAASAMVVGAGMSIWRHRRAYNKAVAAGQAMPTLTKKGYAIKAFQGAAFGLFGAGLGYLASEYLFHPICSPHNATLRIASGPLQPAPLADLPPAIPAHHPVAPLTAVAPAPASVPVPAHVAALDNIKHYAATHKVSPNLSKALAHVNLAKPQSLDDVAVFAAKYLPQDADTVLHAAADQGNLKAKADVIEKLFYGDKALHLTADPESAVDKMVELSKQSNYASKMVDKWVGPSSEIANPSVSGLPAPAPLELVPLQPIAPTAPVLPGASHVNLITVDPASVDPAPVMTPDPSMAPSLPEAVPPTDPQIEEITADPTPVSIADPDCTKMVFDVAKGETTLHCNNPEALGNGNYTIERPSMALAFAPQ